MDTFYVIKLIAPNGNRGYVFDSPDGIMLVVGGIHANITQFPSFRDARNFIREHKMEKKGNRAYIRTNQDLIDEESNSPGISPAQEEVFYVGNDEGMRMFYDSKTGQYFFRMQDVGFCCWRKQDLETLSKQVEDINKELPDLKVEIKSMANHKK